MTVLQRLERLPMARPQWRLLFQGGLGYTFDGMDAALVAFILPSATAVFSLYGILQSDAAAVRGSNSLGSTLEARSISEFRRSRRAT